MYTCPDRAWWEWSDLKKKTTLFQTKTLPFSATLSQKTLENDILQQSRKPKKPTLTGGTYPYNLP